MNWDKKHEPTTFDDMVLHPTVRRRLTKILTGKHSAILSGPPGIGKTTFTNILLKTTGFDYQWFDASEVNIEDIRKQIKGYAITYGFLSNKLVIINEADSMSKIQQAPFKEIIEKAHRTNFIFITNNNILIDAIQSRCILVDFYKPPKPQILTFLKNILNVENITYTQNQLNKIINKYHPDIRKIIQETQVELE